MSEYVQEIARVESVFLGVEDHGILAVDIRFDYGGSGQGTGGYALDRWNDTLGRRVGTEAGTEFLLQLLRAFGVESWDKIKGRTVFVLREPGGGGLIRGIEPLPTERGERLIFADVFNEAVSA